MRRALALALAAALAVGCAAPERRAAVADRSRPAATAQEGAAMLAYLARLRGLREGALAAEAQRQRRAAARDPSDLARVRAALARSLADADDAAVLALAEPVARREDAAPELRAMASFLHAMALDRRRLRESAAAAGTRLRDERRAAEAQKQRADAAEERAGELQQKLDALTELEKSLSDRQPSPTR